MSDAANAEFPCPANHIHRRETLGEPTRLRAIQAVARQNLNEAVQGFHAIEDMKDDAIVEVRRYRSPTEGSHFKERQRMLNLANSVRKLDAAIGALPEALEKMTEAAEDLITIESEIGALNKGENAPSEEQ